MERIESREGGRWWFIRRGFMGSVGFVLEKF